MDELAVWLGEETKMRLRFFSNNNEPSFDIRYIVVEMYLTEIEPKRVFNYV